MHGYVLFVPKKRHESIQSPKHRCFLLGLLVVAVIVAVLGERERRSCTAW